MGRPMLLAGPARDTIFSSPSFLSPLLLPIVFQRKTIKTHGFWQSLQNQLGTKVSLSTTFHPQTDGQSKRVIQVLEDMLRACIVDFGGSWEDHLPLCEFAYNNSYQASIGMAPFEALYGRPCRSPACWAEVGDTAVLGPTFVQEQNEKIQQIRKNMKIAQDRQKSYANNRRKVLEFAVGDHVLLRVSPRKGQFRFGISGKLAPRYIGPFEILDRVGHVAYRLALPPQLAGVHNVFHVSMLRKYHPDPSHVINWRHVELREDCTYDEAPVAIIDRAVRKLRNKEIPMVRVRWQFHGAEQDTWEREDFMTSHFPEVMGVNP